MTDNNTAATGPARSAAELPPTVLFVDDEIGILNALRRLFRPQGYRILVAESGAAGLALLEEETVDLVVSDMRMPEMDGVAFLDQVRQRWPSVTRILLTGYADIGSTIAAINKGEIYRYIAKPWDDNDILMAVRDALVAQRLKSENERLTALTREQNEELRALNSSLEQRVRQRTAELDEANASLKLANESLKQSFLTSIKVFSSLIELRDSSVVGHARRVADLARRLAIRLQLSPRAQQDVFVAGLLHDIGKIGFADTMFAKAVPKMSGEEQVRYRKHALAGANALLPLPELKEIAGLIRSHHERFDGQGFPDGLIGLGIPMGARILAVANDYDGLQIGTLAERRYPPEDAKSMIVKSRGRRYCPQVVDALIDLLGEPREEAGRGREVPVEHLLPGMVLARDVTTREGTLLLAADYVLDARLVGDLQAYAKREDLRLILHVRTDRRVGSAGA